MGRLTNKREVGIYGGFSGSGQLNREGVRIEPKVVNPNKISSKVEIPKSKAKRLISDYRAPITVHNAVVPRPREGAKRGSANCRAPVNVQGAVVLTNRAKLGWQMVEKGFAFSIQSMVFTLDVQMIFKGNCRLGR